MGEAHCRLHNCTSLDIYTNRLICAAACLESWSFRSLLYHISLLLGWDARMIYKEIQMTIEISSKISANIPIYIMIMTMGENPQWLWIMMVVRWRRWKKRWCTVQDQRNDDGDVERKSCGDRAEEVSVKLSLSLNSWFLSQRIPAFCHLVRGSESGHLYYDPDLEMTTRWWLSAPSNQTDAHGWIIFAGVQHRRKKNTNLLGGGHPRASPKN